MGIDSITTANGRRPFSKLSANHDGQKFVLQLQGIRTHLSRLSREKEQQQIDRRHHGTDGERREVEGGKLMGLSAKPGGGTGKNDGDT